MWPFYPTGTLPRDFLADYSQHFGVMEIDSTFCQIPTAKMVDVWSVATLKRFGFAPKVPQAVTREKRLQNCAAEPDALLSTMPRLRPERGPRVFPFDASFRVDSLPMLAEPLTGLPSDLRYAVDVRRRDRFCHMLCRLLEEHHTALVLAGLNYLPELERVSTDFDSVRLLGRRSGTPGDFSRVRLDQKPELTLWPGRIREYLRRGLMVFVLANNRFQGHSTATACALLAETTGVASKP